MRKKILNILIYFLTIFIFVGLFVLIHINDLLIIKNYYFLFNILLINLCMSICYAHLLLSLLKWNKNKVNKNENKN